MFKNNEKRYEYDISSSMPEEIQRYAYKYPNTKIGSDYVSSNATPLNRKSLPGHQTFEEKNRNQASLHQYSTRYNQKNEESFGQRGRTNSTSAVKKSTQKQYPINDKSYIANESLKQTKKVYFGVEELYPRQSEFTNTKFQNKLNDENRRYNGENTQQNFQSAKFQPNNKRGEQVKDFGKQKKYESSHPIHQSGINQKQILQKIGRINKLNEEINNRLQRMLSKIDP